MLLSLKRGLLASGKSMFGQWRMASYSGPQMKFVPQFHVSPIVDIPYAKIDIKAMLNPIQAIQNAPEFNATVEFFARDLARSRSLMSEASQGLLYNLIRNQQSDHVVEIGSFRGGTAEALSRALHANGKGTLHTIGPFDSDYMLPVLESWPEALRRNTRFYPTDSMDFYMKMERQDIRFDLVLVDGNHDYEFALFDIQCAARRMNRGGFIVIDDMNQAGPYFAGVDFLARNPEWHNCNADRPNDDTKAFDRGRSSIRGTDFFVLRAPSVYHISRRPTTFGEVRWPAPMVKGVTLSLASGRQCGTLYVECILRGFGSWHTEGGSAVSQVVDCDGGELSLSLPKPLTTDEGLDRYAVEPWFIWRGEAPLRVTSPAAVF